jgi:hypothetical protein
MIKPEDFYSKNEYPDSGKRESMWKRVRVSLPHERRIPLINIDFRSFAFGFGAAFTVIFVCVGIFTLFSKVIQKEEPAYVRINNAYSKAIDEIEKTMPQFITAGSKSYSFDDLIKTQKTKLKNVNAGIQEIKMDLGSSDFSPIKQSRLAELYKMKLEIISKMITMEENGL